jgi:hypothetical protein
MEKQTNDEKRDQFLKIIDEITAIEKPSLSDYSNNNDSQSSITISQIMNDGKLVKLKEAYIKLWNASIEVLKSYKSKEK